MSVFQDLRCAVRLLRRHPTSAVAAIVALALGIGGTTAIFSVVRAVLLKPLPYREPDRLVMVAEPVQRTAVFRFEPYHFVRTGAEVDAVRRRTAIFEDFAAVQLWSSDKTPRQVVTNDGEVERLRGGIATVNLFELLGVTAATGRTFHASDPPDDVVVISDGLATRRYGDARAAIGRTVRLDGKVRVVIGVLPRFFRFTYPEETEFWVPLAAGILEADRGFAVTYHVVGRLREGVTVDQATAALSSLGRLTDARGRPREAPRLVARPIHEWMVGQVRPALLLVFAISALLLAIAFANAALLLLARSVPRSRELALRAALGASRVRLFQQVLSECGVVGAAGAVGGLVIAAIALPAIKQFVPAGVPRVDEMSVDGWALLVALAAGFVSALVCCPGAMRARASAQPQQVLQRSGPAATGNRQVAWWRRAMLSMQVALVLVLLAGGALLLRSFLNLLHTELGFEPATTVTMRLRVWNVPRADPEGGERKQQRLREEMVARLRAVPGVTDVSSTSTLPFEGFDGATPFPVGDDMTRFPRTFVNFRAVGRDFFRVLEIPLLAGRTFTREDTADSQKVMILSRALATSFFGDRPAVGQTIWWMVPFEIVGVVDDVRWRRADEAPGLAFYVPDTQKQGPSLFVVVRSDLPAAAVARAARDVVREIDPAQPVEEIRPLSALVDDARAERRFYATAATTFGLLAVILASVGLYGAVAASVAERLREIGVRMALGADARRVLTLMLRQGLMPVVIGLLIGSLAAFWGVGLLRGFLFEVSPGDPVTLAAVPTLLLIVAVAATYLPARRALRVDPAIALRQE